MDGSVISMEMLTILLVAMGLAGLIVTSQSRLEGRLTKKIQEFRQGVAALSNKVDDLKERIVRMEGRFEVFEKFLRWNGAGAAQKEGD